MDTKELVEMARSLAAQIDPMLIGGRDAALLNGLADTIERLERERDDAQRLLTLPTNIRTAPRRRTG
jgi:hypothetical protein